jgi:hypothetical protein
MNSPSVKSTLPAAILLTVIGSAGLIYVIINTLPYPGPLWLFFFLSVLAVTGIFLPIAAFLNLRFPFTPPAGRNVVVREASLVGIYFATLAWLQIDRVLTLGLGLLLAAGLILIEFLIRLREKGKWNPEKLVNGE